MAEPRPEVADRAHFQEVLGLRSKHGPLCVIHVAEVLCRFLTSHDCATARGQTEAVIGAV
jgi:hypothetical protein